MQQAVIDEPVFYHVWFGTKRRKWLLQGEVEEKIKELIKEIVKDKGIELLACETMVEHVHLLLKVKPDKLSEAMHLLKGASSRRIFKAFPDLKLDANTMGFWQARYGAKLVPVEALKSTMEYIKTQKDRPEKFERPNIYPRLMVIDLLGLHIEDRNSMAKKGVQRDVALSGGVLGVSPRFTSSPSPTLTWERGPGGESLEEC